MSVRVVTPPASPLLTVDQVRTQLGLGTGVPDDKIAALVDAATAGLDGPDGWLGRAVRIQTLEVRRPCFPAFGPIPLSYPPIRTIEEIGYTDPNGIEKLLADPLHLEGEGLIFPPSGMTWPATRDDGPGAVRIRYTCGYDDGAVPSPILQAVCLQVAALHAMMKAKPGLSSETVVGVYSRSWQSGDIGEVYDKAALRLLAPYRAFA